METPPDRLAIAPLAAPPHARVHVPGSKSITNRALVLAALTARSHAVTLAGALRSEDTEVMIGCLRALGFRVEEEWERHSLRIGPVESDRLIPAERADLWVGNSGTTMRFVTALVSLGEGIYRLDGVPRMRERPILDLVEALGQLGVRATCQPNGCPPVLIETRGWKERTAHIHGGVSSQFLSGLMLAAPFASQETCLLFDGMVSRPYIEMTETLLRQWGLELHDEEGLHGYRVPGKQRSEVRLYSIEPDASAASYFFAAAAITRGTVWVAGMARIEMQGDVRFVEVLRQMGCRVDERDEGGTTVQGRELHGIDVDMNDISDTVMTLAAVACFAKGPTTIRNVAHIRHKETDRLRALATELRRIGAEVEERTDGLKITPGPLHGAEVETYQDHRMAMSLALVGLRVPGIVLENPGCVAKTYPEFFADLEQLR